MANKHIFIALGGTGVNVASYLKYKIYERTKATELKTRMEVMEETYRFLFVDTDSRDVARFNNLYKHVYEAGRVDFINSVELLNLGPQNPAAIWREAKAHPDSRINSRILEACPEMVAANMDDRTLSLGAGALRLKARLAFAQMESDFISKLVTDINQLNPVDKNPEPNVIHYWVIASCNGGTGSGTVNDVLYLVNMLHKTHVDPGNPIVGLMLFMPRMYMNINPQNPRYPINSFAVFKELDAFQTWSTDPEKNTLFHRLAVLGDTVNINNTLPYRPFEFCIPVDINTDNGNNLGNQDKVYRNSAELLYYIHDGEGGAGFKSFLNNNEDGDTSIRDIHAYLIPLGYVAIRKPEEEFKNFMSLRLKYELLRYGIIGEGIDSKTQRQKEMSVLFESVIKKQLLTDKAEGIFFKTVRTLSKQMIEKSLPQQIIMDSKGKPVSELPANVNRSAAERIIRDVEGIIQRKNEEKEQTLEQVKQELWRWTEKNSRKYGLQYVRDVLLELDEHCTNLYDAYETSEKAKELRDISDSKKALEAHRDSLDKELDNLFQQATEIRIGERLRRNNHEDVQAYFNQLKKWVTASVNVMVTDTAFEMIRDLAVGGQGILDDILRHVRKLLAEASVALNREKGIASAYKNLAEQFFNKKDDVTSIYIPDITQYSNGDSWIEEGNKFSEWYSRIIARTTAVVKGEGFAPLRNGDAKCSIEAFFDHMINCNKAQLTQEGYLVENESHLFTNKSRSDYQRIIDDILYYAGIAMEARIMEDTVIAQEWSKKTLAQFYDELHIDAQKLIRRRTNPPVFFPYNRSLNLRPLTDKGFSVGPNGVIQDVFESTEETGRMEFYHSDDPAVMYKVDTKIGLSFDYYDLYRMLADKYEENANKEFYHFHQVFAHAGGNAEQIKLPRDIQPSTVLLVKYLILNEISPSLSHLMKEGKDAYNAKFYAKSPVIFEGMVARFATASSLKMIDDELIEIRISDGTSQFFQTVNVEKPEHRYTDILRGFKAKMATGRFDALIKDLIKDINFLDSDLIQQKYYESVASLKAKLDKEWEKAGKLEKETIGEMLEILSDRLDTVSKFLDEKKKR